MLEGALRSPPKGEFQSLADCRQTKSVQSSMVCRVGSRMIAPTWTLTSSSSRARLSSFRLAVRFARSHSTSFTTAPCRWLSRPAQKWLSPLLAPPSVPRPQFIRLGRKERRAASVDWRDSSRYEVGLCTPRHSRLELLYPFTDTAQS